MGIGEGGDQEVRHADSTVAASAGQLPLRAECRLPVLVIGWQVFVRQTAVRPELFLVGRIAGAVERR